MPRESSGKRKNTNSPTHSADEIRAQEEAYGTLNARAWMQRNAKRTPEQERELRKVWPKWSWGSTTEEEEF